jgi:cell division septal protein FtsQ
VDVNGVSEPRYLRPGGNREVRRRRQRRTAFRAALWCAFWLAGAALALLGFDQAWRLLNDPGRFPLKRVIVQGAGDRIDAEIEARLAPLLGRNVLTIDIAQVEREASGHPWVRSASVRRRLPSSILVVLKPRDVAVLVLAGDGVHMVDASGSDIGRLDPRDASENHPIVTGVMEPGGRASAERLSAGIRAAVTLEEKAPELAAEISTLDLSRSDRLTATLRDYRPPIYLSPADPIRNVDRLAVVRERLAAAGVEAEYLDLRFKDRIAVLPIRAGESASGT